jgi:hypothetical protein
MAERSREPAVGSETSDPLNEPIKEEAMQIDDNWTMSEGTEELDVAQVDWCLGVDTSAN